MWRKAMVYLGLGDDAEYDDYDAGPGDEPGRNPSPGRAQQPPQRQTPSSNVSTVSPSGPVPSHSDEQSAVSGVRPIGSRPDEPRGAAPASQTVKPSGLGAARPRPQVVRPITVTPNAKPHVVVPASFNQAQEVADKFKGSQPVIMNLQEADRELSRRLIDFSSGLCYGLGGQMERLANQVYLLTPVSVEVSAEERRRLHERGYDA